MRGRANQPFFFGNSDPQYVNMRFRAEVVVPLASNFMSIASPSVRQAALAATLDGVHTDVATFAYADRIVVLITQFGKIGNLSSVQVDLSGDGNSLWSATSILGCRDDSWTSLCVRQIAECIGQHSDKPALISCTLQPKAQTPASLRALLALLDRDDLRVW